MAVVSSISHRNPSPLFSLSNCTVPPATERCNALDPSTWSLNSSCLDSEGPDIEPSPKGSRDNVSGGIMEGSEPGSHLSSTSYSWIFSE